MLETPTGIVIEVRFLQSANAALFNVVSLAGSYADYRFSQFSNA